jgi:hypothetical protein
MKRLLYAASALGAVALAAPTANAAVLFAGACVPGSLAVPCVPAQEATGHTAEPFPTSVGNFSISVRPRCRFGERHHVQFPDDPVSTTGTAGGGLLQCHGRSHPAAFLLFMSTFTPTNATTTASFKALREQQQFDVRVG